MIAIMTLLALAGDPVVLIEPAQRTTASAFHIVGERPDTFFRFAVRYAGEESVLSATIEAPLRYGTYYLGRKGPELLRRSGTLEILGAYRADSGNVLVGLKLSPLPRDQGPGQFFIFTFADGAWEMTAQATEPPIPSQQTLFGSDEEDRPGFLFHSGQTQSVLAIQDGKWHPQARFGGNVTTTCDTAGRFVLTKVNKGALHVSRLADGQITLAAVIPLPKGGRYGRLVSLSRTAAVLACYPGGDDDDRAVTIVCRRIRAGGLAWETTVLARRCVGGVVTKDDVWLAEHGVDERELVVSRVEGQQPKEILRRRVAFNDRFSIRSCRFVGAAVIKVVPLLREEYRF